MASSSGIKLGRAYVLIDAVDRTRQACNAALKNIATLADNVMAIGTNLTIGATIAVTLDASASRAFREFEETMLKVKAKSKDTAGATVAAYDRLIEKAQQLGRVTKFTAPQVADAMAGMAAAGLSRSTIDKSIKNVLNLAVATGVEIPTASRIAMAAMQQFNMTAEQSAEICDVLSAAVNNSALTLEDIGETFKYSAPLAREFGMDIKQLAIVVAALGNAGIKGSQAGTSLRQMMVKLAKPGKYNLDKFNQDFEANVQRDIVVNDGGVLRKKTRPVIDILRDMGKAMDDYEKKHPDIDPQKKLAVFADLFGRYAMTSGATLADNMKNMDTLMRAINHSAGTAEKTAKIMNSGVVGAHYAFISAWQDVAIQYGKAINETVMTFYEGFTKIAHVISNFIRNNQNVINIITGVTAATAAVGVSMLTGAGAVKTFTVVGGMFTSAVGAMASAAYGFAIALNSWINPLISAEGLLRGLVATMTGVSVVGRGVGGVLASFAPRWNLPWQAVPAGASRLTVAQAGKARGLLSAYYARSLAEGLPAGTLHAEIAAREAARVAAIKHSLTHEGMLETLNSRVTNPRMRELYGNYHRTSIARTAAADALRVARSTEHAKEVTKTIRGQAREAVKTITGKHKTFLDLAKGREKEINEQYNSKLTAIKKSSSNEAIRMSDRAETRAFNAYNAARTTRRGLEHNRRVLNKAIGMEQMLLASGTLGEAESKLAKDKIKGYRRSLKNTEKSLGEIRTVEDKALQKYKVHKEHGLALRDKYEPAVANRIRRLDASRDAALAAVAARRGAATAKVEQYKQYAKTGYKDTVARKLEREVATAERGLTRATAARNAATTAMRTETARARSHSPYIRGLSGRGSASFMNRNLTNDFARNNQYLRERMRMLRLAGFHDTTRAQHMVRSAEILRTRRLMTANNMMLGRQRWGAFFRPFTNALQRATRAVGQFGMQILSSISRIGLHPIRGTMSLFGKFGSSIFAGLAPGGGILKGIGATLKFAFSYLKKGFVPLMKMLLRYAIQIAAAPLTWVAGLTYATLQGGKLKEVMAGVYIAISAIGVGISKLWGQLKNLFSWLAKSIKENMAKSNEIIDPVIDLWKGTISRLFGDLKDSFGVITEAIGAGRWGDAFKVLGATWKVIRAELGATLRNNWEHMKYTFMTVWNRVVDYFQNGEGLLGIIKWALTGLWGIAKWALAGLYNVGTMLVGKALKIGQRIMLGDTAVYTSNRWSERSLKANIIDSMRELKSRGINIDLSKYKNIQEYYNLVQHMRRADAINAVAYREGINGTGARHVFNIKAMNDEWEVFLQEALASVQGTPFVDPNSNFGGWGYTEAEIEEQRKKAMDETGAIRSVADDPGVIEARANLEKIEQNTRGNVERQKAAEAAKQLKEREEGVVKELGEEGVGRIGEILEGFYDFSDTNDNRKKGLILAAGEYITEMGISIEKFAEIIESLKEFGGLAKTANLYSEKSNIEWLVNLADDTIGSSFGYFNMSMLKDGIRLKLTNDKGDPVEKFLAAERDGVKLTNFERLKELGEVLSTLTPDEKRKVYEQFTVDYGKEATDAIGAALDKMYARGANVDFTDEENLYKHNPDASTEYGKLSQYERGFIDKNFDYLKNRRYGTELDISKDREEQFKELISKGLLGDTWTEGVASIKKNAEFQDSFGNKKTVTKEYTPELQKKFNLHRWSELAEIYGGGDDYSKKVGDKIRENPNKFIDFIMQSVSFSEASGYDITTAGRYIKDINETFKSKELDKKVKYYGGDVEGMTNMEKFSLIKEREGFDGVLKLLPKHGSLEDVATNFAKWLTAPQKEEKPQVWTVVQANIKGMLDTFKQYTENRNRVILDRRAKEEKDAKAKEEEAKKKEDEDRLKNIESGIEDLSACVKGTKRLNINMEYA